MLVIGHRGASHDFPENTLAAFEGAAAQGADWVELDVRRTADGALIVHHDAELPDGRLICDVLAAELPDSVTTLELALATCRPMGVNVEIKNSPVEPGYDPTDALVGATIDAIIAAGHGLEILISCFELATLDQVRAVNSAMSTGYLVLGTEDPIDAVEAAVAGGHRAVNPWDPMVTADSVARAHAAGVEVNVWTVDDPDRIRQLAAWGVDAVITNRPAVALEAVRAG